MDIESKGSLGIGFLFPGQGAQKIGMLSEFREHFPAFRDFLGQVSDWTGIDIAKIIYEPNDLIDKTEYTQLVVLAVELGLLRVLAEAGVKPRAMAGYSLGEYSCLVCSGALRERTAVELVVKRARFMEEACESGVGGMAAVIGLGWDEVGKCLQSYDKVWIANYNTASLVSISGEKGQVESACADLRSAGARRVIPINVSGPFHTPMLKEASERFRKALENAVFSDPDPGYFADYDGELITDAGLIANSLALQISSPVRWSQCMSGMLRMGLDGVVEVGPGSTLRGFLRGEERLRKYGLETLGDLDCLVHDLA